MFGKKKKLARRRTSLIAEFGEYLGFLRKYIKRLIYLPFSYFEAGKDVVSEALYRDRGKYAKPLMHVMTVGVVFLVVMVGPVLFTQTDRDQVIVGSKVLSAATADEVSFYTTVAEEVHQFRGGEVVSHTVLEGETLGDIAKRYNLNPNTIMWENDLSNENSIKEGQTLRILPVDGVRHRVTRGDTIFTIAKKYGLDESAAQVIVDYPFNDFLNDESFDLVVGQSIMVPGGVRPKVAAVPTAVFSLVSTPDAGTVSSTGQFVWPAAGGISQGYSVFHRAIDISNRGGGPILAADSGVVTTSGWSSSGYGNHVVIDHGNGFITLYAHMSSLAVTAGQTVNQGNVLGQMGSTGRSTGVHLHFEVRTDGGLANPLEYLK